MTTTAILLVLGAVALLMLEAAVPSFGLFGLMAAAAYTYALVVGFRESRELGIWVVALGVLLAPPAFFFGLKLLRKTKLGRASLLEPPTAEELGRGPDPALAALVGRTGVATTELRPAGRVEFEGVRYEAASAFGYVEKGAAVRAVKVDGPRVVVEKTDLAQANKESSQ